MKEQYSPGCASRKGAEWTPAAADPGFVFPWSQPSPYLASVTIPQPAAAPHMYLPRGSRSHCFNPNLCFHCIKRIHPTQEGEDIGINVNQLLYSNHETGTLHAMEKQ